MQNIKENRLRKYALASTLALTMLLSLATPVLAAEPPQGALNRTVEVTDGLNPGTYLVNDSYNNDPYTSYRLIAPDYSWDPETMESYVFDPSDYPDMEWHPDGFPLRATFRTPVDHLGEMKYLAETYPDITKLILLGYTNGISDEMTNPNIFEAFDEFKIPVYALEISSAPGVQDGRPATLHQAGNHGGELDSNELAANLAWYLTTKYGEVDEVTELVDTTRIYILPYTNADGNMVSFRQTNGNRRTNARGVDLNRNWAYRWGSDTGSRGTPGTSGTYRGVSPNSEPETAAITSLYRADNVVTSISGHTSGQIVIFAWAYVRNPTDAHPLLSRLAKEQTDLNGHTPQNGNVMYAQSGEINDYLWGSMRALGFTYEYSTGQVNPYLGNLTGNNYMVASYLDNAGHAKEMKTNYARVAPEEDVTGQLAFITNEFFAMGYQDLPVDADGNGINNSPYLDGPLLRRLTTDIVQAELDKDPDFVNGKIFMSHIALSNTHADAVARLLKENGALGWIVVNTSSNGGYGELRPNAAYSPEDIAPFPVGSLLKGYAADVHDNWVKDSDITVTFKADMKDFHSVNFQWERNKPAYMRNMAMAREYANQVSGTIADPEGNLLAEASLDASLVIEGKILNTDGTEAAAESQWQETHQPRYDVEDGQYNWFMLPSKQTEYADKGWDVTASANGRYHDIKNIRFPVDSEIAVQRGMDPEIYADPMFQQSLEDVDFVLPEALKTHFDFDKMWTADSDLIIPFSAFRPDESGAIVKGEVSGIFATVNGEAVEVLDLGNGNYVVRFNPEMDLGITEETDLELVIDFEGGLPHSALKQTIQIGGSSEFTKVTSFMTGNRQASIDFTIGSANGKGYEVFLQELGSADGFQTYSNVNYNSKGVNIRGLENGTTYFAYIEYMDGTRSGIVMFTAGK